MKKAVNEKSTDGNLIQWISNDILKMIGRNYFLYRMINH